MLKAAIWVDTLSFSSSQWLHAWTLTSVEVNDSVINFEWWVLQCFSRTMLMCYSRLCFQTFQLKIKVTTLLLILITAGGWFQIQTEALKIIRFSFVGLRFFVETSTSKFLWKRFQIAHLYWNPLWKFRIVSAQVALDQCLFNCVLNAPQSSLSLKYNEI